MALHRKPPLLASHPEVEDITTIAEAQLIGVGLLVEDRLKAWRSRDVVPQSEVIDLCLDVLRLVRCGKL